MKDEGFDILEHLKNHPHLICEECAAIAGGYDAFNKLRGMRRDERRLHLARMLELPSEARPDRKTLTRIIFHLAGIIERAYVIKTKGIEIGCDVIKDGERRKVTNIAINYTLRLNGSSGAFEPHLVDVAEPEMAT